MNIRPLSCITAYLTPYGRPSSINQRKEGTWRYAWRGGVYTFLGPLPFNNHFTPVCQLGKINDFLYLRMIILKNKYPWRGGGFTWYRRPHSLDSSEYCWREDTRPSLPTPATCYTHQPRHIHQHIMSLPCLNISSDPPFRTFKPLFDQ